MWFQDVNNLDEAGWFQEAHTCPDKFGKQWAMTPTHKLLSSEGPRDIILLSTGGFAPIHNGHILMMEVAKSYMESRGFRVRGGYVSPGHDDYVVGFKNVHIYAPERLAIANKILQDNPWIMVDPWESIGCSCSVNYTTVIDHLEELFNCQVCYVVGSDNARFSLAFKSHGMLCIVQRSADVLPNPKYRERSYMLASERVFIADNEPIPGSSTAVRNKEQPITHTKKKLILRVDSASEPYISDLLSILKEYYVDVNVVHVSEQSLPSDIANLISLDQMLTSTYGNLGMSRNYAEGGYTKLGYINRPGTLSLKQQASSFIEKNVSLFDDDVVSGDTMRQVTILLESVGCKVVSYHALSFTDAGMYEIMDSRDFLPVKEGGLVVNGKRVPYIYPYVCPYVRASILPEKAEEFSDRIRNTFWN